MVCGIGPCYSTVCTVPYKNKHYWLLWYSTCMIHTLTCIISVVFKSSVFNHSVNKTFNIGTKSHSYKHLYCSKPDSSLILQGNESVTCIYYITVLAKWPSNQKQLVNYVMHPYLLWVSQSHKYYFYIIFKEKHKLVRHTQLHAFFSCCFQQPWGSCYCYLLLMWDLMIFVQI